MTDNEPAFPEEALETEDIQLWLLTNNPYPLGTSENVEFIYRFASDQYMKHIDHAREAVIDANTKIIKANRWRIIGPLILMVAVGFNIGAGISEMVR